MRRVTLPARSAASLLLLVQGAGVAVAGVVLGVRALGPGTTDRTGAEVLAAIAVLAGAGIGLLARAVRRDAGWARSPVLVVEVICVPVAYNLVRNGRWAVGVPLAALAVAVVVLLARAGAFSADR